MRRICWSLLVAFICSYSYAQVTVTLNDESNFVLAGQYEGLLGVDFTSPGGALRVVANDDPGPFQFLLQNQPTQVTFGSLSDGVSLDGEIVLPVGMQPDAFNDVAVMFGTHTEAGVVEPSGGEPSTWQDSFLLQTEVDNIWVNHKRFNIPPHLDGMVDSDEFVVRYLGLDPESGEHAEVLPHVNRVFVGAWEFTEQFDHDDEKLTIGYGGQQAEFYDDGRFFLPEGWSYARIYDDVLVSTSGSSFVATPEPSGFAVLCCGIFAFFILRNRR